MEAALDDPEHISLDGYSDELLTKVRKITAEVEKLLKSSESGRMLKEGIKTVILGKPNAGKSSLLNVLLGEERAIVTENRRNHPGCAGRTVTAWRGILYSCWIRLESVPLRMWWSRSAWSGPENRQRTRI